MYLVIPLALYASERIHPFFRGKDHRVNIIKVCVSTTSPLFFVLKHENDFITSKFQAIIYTGNVLALYMSKPQGFKYKSGMYLFLKCPDISSFEW